MFLCRRSEQTTELNNKGSTHLREKERLCSDFPLEIIGVSTVMGWLAHLLSL